MRKFQYILYAFPAYMVYFQLTHENSSWGFGFLWMVEVFVIQVVVTSIVLVACWVANRNLFALNGKISLHTLVASSLILGIAFFL